MSNRPEAVKVNSHAQDPHERKTKAALQKKVKRKGNKGGSVFDVGVDLGTSPHGLPVDLPVSHQETFGASSCHSPAKPVLTSPSVYHTADLEESCRIIEEAAKKSKQVFTVTLTEAQLLHAWSQSERTLNRTLKDIKRGLCVEADSHVERSLHKLLGDVVYSRLSWVGKAHATIVGNAKGGSTWRKQMQSEFDQEDEL